MDCRHHVRFPAETDRIADVSDWLLRAKGDIARQLEMKEAANFGALSSCSVLTTRTLRHLIGKLGECYCD
jgi:hypothetical protein